MKPLITYRLYLPKCPINFYPITSDLLFITLQEYQSTVQNSEVSQLVAHCEENNGTILKDLFMSIFQHVSVCLSVCVYCALVVVVSSHCSSLPAMNGDLIFTGDW